MLLKRELETYAREKARLLAEDGRFVVIQGDTVIGTYTTYEDALQVGYERCGLTDFLVKKIESVETVHWVTGIVETPCPS